MNCHWYFFDVFGLAGLWSNIFAVNLLDIWNAFGISDKFWQQHVQAKIKNIGKFLIVTSVCYLSVHISNKEKEWKELNLQDVLRLLKAIHIMQGPSLK